MAVTINDIENNFAKYLRLSFTEDVLIYSDGKVVAKLVNPHRDRINVAKSLFGILPDDGFSIKQARQERLSRI